MHQEGGFDAIILQKDCILFMWSNSAVFGVGFVTFQLKILLSNNKILLYIVIVTLELLMYPPTFFRCLSFSYHQHCLISMFYTGMDCMVWQELMGPKTTSFSNVCFFSMPLALLKSLCTSPHCKPRRTTSLILKDERAGIEQVLVKDLHDHAHLIGEGVRI